MKYTTIAFAAVAIAAGASFGASAKTTAIPASHAVAARLNATKMAPRRVEEVQTALDNHGERIAIDGIWGPKTAVALRDFQTRHDLKASGHLDPQTWRKLDPPSWG